LIIQQDSHIFKQDLHWLCNLRRL